MSQKTTTGKPDRDIQVKVPKDERAPQTPAEGQRPAHTPDETELFAPGVDPQYFGSGSYGMGGSNQEGNYGLGETNPRGGYGSFTDSGGYGSPTLYGLEGESTEAPEAPESKPPESKPTGTKPEPV